MCQFTVTQHRERHAHNTCIPSSYNSLQNVLIYKTDPLIITSDNTGLSKAENLKPFLANNYRDPCAEASFLQSSLSQV